MTTVTVHRPGTMSVDAESPDFDKWTFNVTVNGRAGVSSYYMEHGSTESAAAHELYAALMADPGSLEGITSAGSSPGDAGSPSTPTGPITGPVIHPDDDDDDEPHKVKTADGT